MDACFLFHCDGLYNECRDSTLLLWANHTCHAQRKAVRYALRATQLGMLGCSRMSSE